MFQVIGNLSSKMAVQKIPVPEDMNALEKRLLDQTDELKKLKDQLRKEVEKRKKIEQTCRVSQKYHADTQRVAKLGSWNWNVLTDEVKWSDELFRLLEYNPAEVKPSRKAFLDRVHPDDLQALNAGIQSLLTENKPFYIDHRIVLPDGSIRHFNSTGRLDLKEKRKPVSFYGTMQDITVRKQTELELRLKESAINSAISGIGMTDMEGRMIYVNDSLVKMWGFDEPGEILGRSLPEFWVGDTIFETIKALMEHGSHMGEDTGRRKDGTTFAVQFTASIIKDESGHPMAMFGSFIDITEFKRARQEIMNSAQFLKVILSSLHDHISVIDQKGEILMVNDAWLEFARLNDVTSIDLISPGCNYLNACSSSADETDLYARRALHGIKSVLSNKTSSFTMEYPCSSPTEERYFAMTVVPLLTADGGAVIAHRNITLRKQAEQQAQKRELQLMEAQRIAHLGSWEWNVLNDEITWSDETYRIFGFDPEKTRMNYGLYLKMIHPEDRKTVKTAINNGLANPEEKFQIQYRILRKDKSIRILEEQGKIITGDDGQPVKIVGTTHDLTEFKNAEAESKRLQSELEHVQRVGTLDALASAIAHEINQPLQAILSNAQAALRFLGSNHPDLNIVSESLQDIIQDDKRAGEMIRQIRNFVKKEDVTPRSYNLNDVIERVLDLLHSELVVYNVKLSTDLDPEIRELTGNPVQMQQVILNLLINAIEALQNTHPDKRRVMVSTRANGENGVFIEITDTGPGIRENELDLIFESFHTTKSQGMGLGLTMCQSIINAAGGTIMAENVTKGGAKFTVGLPSDNH